MPTQQGSDDFFLELQSIEDRLKAIELGLLQPNAGYAAAASPWTDLVLTAGWVASTDTVYTMPPQYRTEGSVVRFRGIMKRTTDLAANTASSWASLPVTLRFTNPVYLNTWSYVSGVFRATDYIAVSVAGDCTFAGGVVYPTGGIVYLDGHVVPIS